MTGYSLWYVLVLLSHYQELVVFGQGTVSFSLTSRDNGILGTSLEFICQYTYQGTEITRSATFSRKRSTEPSFSDIATVTIQVNPIYDITDDDLKGRSEMFSNITVVRLVVNSIKCSDRAEYKCRFFISNQSNDFVVNSATSESLEVKANKDVDDPVCPNVVTQCIPHHRGTVDQQQLEFHICSRPKVPQVSFTPREIIENETVELTCTGNVGRPAGTLVLFLVTNGVASNLNAEVGAIEVETNGCTFERSAKVFHTFTAADNGRTAFRCRPHQEFADPNVHLNQTQPFDVSYIPRETKMFYSVDGKGKVEVNPGSVVEVHVGSDVVLMCQTDSNPPPLYTWSFESEDSNDTATDSTTSTGLFNLQPVRLEQSGLYICAVTQSRNLSVSKKVGMTLSVSITGTTQQTEECISTDQVKLMGGDIAAIVIGGFVLGLVLGAIGMLCICVHRGIPDSRVNCFRCRRGRKEDTIQNNDLQRNTEEGTDYYSVDSPAQSHDTGSHNDLSMSDPNQVVNYEDIPEYIQLKDDRVPVYIELPSDKVYSELQNTDYVNGPDSTVYEGLKSQRS